MKWFINRLSENSSRAALVTAVGAWAGVWAKIVTPDQAVGATLAAVGAFATHDKPVAG